MSRGDYAYTRRGSAPDTLDLALERLWGIETPPLKPLTSYVAWIDRPQGFTVIEPRPHLTGRGPWAVYLVRRVGIDSVRAARLIASGLSATRYSLQGLKDACAAAYQYMAFRLPAGSEAPATIELSGRLTAWLVGRSSEPLRRGGHGFNAFRLVVSLEGDAGRLCAAARKLRWVPGYYGPQRFGVERPNTHYTGLLRLRGEYGLLLAEYLRRYPAEEERPPGHYEARAAELAHAARSHVEASKPGPRLLQLEAIQAYLFNRTLSLGLRLAGRPEPLAEHWIPVRCPQGPVRVPAARLPGPGLRGSSLWARVARYVAEAEGVAGILLSGPSWRLGKPLRPLFFPVCRLKCRPRARREAEICVVLPAGAYATMLLRILAWIDWRRYAKCGGISG